MTRYAVRLTPAAARSLRSLPPQPRARVIERIDALADNPRPAGCEKLRGSDSYYRIRVGDYRVIYHIADVELVVTITHAGHRRDVYRGLDR